MSGRVYTPTKNMFLSNDWLMDAQHGVIKGWSAGTHLGKNASVGSSYTDIWPAGTGITWLTTAAALEAVSDDANDTAAGSGARKIMVYGLDENWDEVSEEITLAGLSASSATTTTFIRVNKIIVTEVGAYSGKNAGNITLQVKSAGDVMGYVAENDSESHHAHYTTPRNRDYNVHELHVVSDSNKSIDFVMMTRANADDNTAPYSPMRRRAEYYGLTGFSDISFKVPLEIAGKTDLHFQGKVASGTGGITIEQKYSVYDTTINGS